MRNKIPKTPTVVVGEEKERRSDEIPSEQEIDEAVDESFPASDPPALGGCTRIESDEERKDRRHSGKKLTYRERP